MIRCLHCNAETSNGLTLCELCQRFAASVFEMLPIYFHNLARWRPGRAGSRPVPGSRVLYDGHTPNAGTGDRISDTLDETLGAFPSSEQAAKLHTDETSNALTTWARMLADDRPHLARLLDRLASARTAEAVTEAQAVAWLCVGFNRYLTSISTLDWCGEFVRDLGDHEARLRGLTESFVPGWYAGGCRQLVGFDDEGAAVRCGSGTYVVPGLTWVTCGACGATTYARDHLEVVLDEAREWVAGPMRLAEAVVSLVDTELSIPRLHKRISKWGERERIEALRRIDSDGDPCGPKRYRLGDVLDRLFAEGATRIDGLGTTSPKAS